MESFLPFRLSSVRLSETGTTCMTYQCFHLVTSWGMSPFLEGDQQIAMLASLGYLLPSLL